MRLLQLAIVKCDAHWTEPDFKTRGNATVDKAAKGVGL